jgi:hypothetical protein
MYYLSAQVAMFIFVYLVSCMAVTRWCRDTKKILGSFFDEIDFGDKIG